MRVIEKRLYSKEGWLRLPGHFRNRILKHRLDINIYEYSSGKLTAGEIARLVIKENGLSIKEDEFLHTVMVPFYRRLEKTQHVLFYL
jgi:hypothetical protein